MDKQPEEHKTISDYCCACEYDQAVMERKIREAYKHGSKNTSKKIYNWAKSHNHKETIEFIKWLESQEDREIKNKPLYFNFTA